MSAVVQYQPLLAYLQLLKGVVASAVHVRGSYFQLVYARSRPRQPRIAYAYRSGIIPEKRLKLKNSSTKKDITFLTAVLLFILPDIDPDLLFSPICLHSFILSYMYIKFSFS